MVNSDDVIRAALAAVEAAYDYDTLNFETDEEANFMYARMMSRISKIPLLAVAEWQGRNPNSRMSEAEIMEILYTPNSKASDLRTH